MAIKSITQRWIINSLCIILTILTLGGVAFTLITRNYYYTAVRQAVMSRSDTISTLLLWKMDEDTVNINAEFRNIVENFDEKDKIEVAAVNHKGQIVLSSSGFSYNQQVEMSDYEQAINSSNGLGTYFGKSATGERIMAITRLVPYINGDYSALRYMVSMEKIESALLWLVMGYIGISLIIVAFVMVSGSYFIKSIVLPVREVGTAARRFATGDMSTRIEKKSNDELGELCDIINYMADEISTSEQMKNEFISSVSHELRTPLTAIKGWAETLAGVQPQDHEMLQKGMWVISSETERLSGMVEELLDFSRMQSGRFTLVKTKMDLLAELGEAVMIYTERAKRDNKQLIYNEPEMVSYLFGDKNRLKQVFINIIDNALKYSDNGDTVTVDVKEEDGVIKVIIADTGCGIPKQDLPKIKEKFYKANTTRRGSGIGLAVANEIVHMHDGEILIDSEIDVGTTVTIQLPVNLKKGEDRKTQIMTPAGSEK